MGIENRLTRLERHFKNFPRRDQLTLITAIPFGESQAEGRAPGLYRSERVGSTAGVLVFDSAKGEPEVPEDKLAPWGLVIVSGPDAVEPPETRIDC